MVYENKGTPSLEHVHGGEVTMHGVDSKHPVPKHLPGMGGKETYRTMETLMYDQVGEDIAPNAVLFLTTKKNPQQTLLLADVLGTAAKDENTKNALLYATPLLPGEYAFQATQLLFAADNPTVRAAIAKDMIAMVAAIKEVAKDIQKYDSTNPEVYARNMHPRALIKKLYGSRQEMATRLLEKLPESTILDLSSTTIETLYKDLTKPTKKK